jgi:phage baseplate assembly protein W
MADFGSDISTYVNGDLDPTFTVITGPRVVAEAVARRLETPRGRLPEDPNYGYDLRILLNGSFTAADLARHESAIAAEAEKDPRVERADATLSLGADRRLVARVVLHTAEGPFALVLDVSQVSVALLRFDAA